MSHEEAERIRLAAIRKSIELACKLYRFRHAADSTGAQMFQQILEQTLLGATRDREAQETEK